MTIEKYYIPRGADVEKTFATVTVKYEKGAEAYSAKQLLALLRSAITHWINSTDRGGNAYKSSCRDFNIGDLSLECNEKDMKIIVTQIPGVSSIKVTTDTEFCDHWVFDTHLFNDEDIRPELKMTH